MQTTCLLFFLSILFLPPVPPPLPPGLSMSHSPHSVDFHLTTTTLAPGSHDGYYRRKCPVCCSHLSWPLSSIGQVEPSLFSEASYLLGCCDSIKYLISGSFLSSSPIPLALSTLVFYQRVYLAVNRQFTVVVTEQNSCFPNHNCCPDSLPQVIESPVMAPLLGGY